MIVVDASIIGPLLLADERPLPEPIIGKLLSEPLIAPVHWPLEVANLLLMAERRGRLSAERRSSALREVQGWSVRLDADTAIAAWRRTSELATQHDLTVYDAAYLELALRRDVPVATRDRALARAAHAASNQVVSDLT